PLLRRLTDRVLPHKRARGPFPLLLCRFHRRTAFLAGFFAAGFFAAARRCSSLSIRHRSTLPHDARPARCRPPTELLCPTAGARRALSDPRRANRRGAP